MTHSITQTQLANKFECLGEACVDTCCQNWSMQVDAATLARYQKEAPELLAFVDKESDGLPVMKRDAQTRQCVKLEGGWCGLHKQYGDVMLGDACHFYPRVTRQLGSQTLMTATTSCPEIVRLLLTMEAPFADVPNVLPRLPHTIKNYLPNVMDESAALAVHQAFLSLAQDNTISAERALARMSSVARSMALLEEKTWHQSIPLYLRLADSRLPKAEGYDADDCNVLHALCGLIVASKKPISLRLQQTITAMEKALGATLDWQAVTIAPAPDSVEKSRAMRRGFAEDSAYYAPILSRYLQSQIALTLFPFAGLGSNPEERITFIGVRFATLKLALSAAHYQTGRLPQEEIIRIIQSLSRFMDHLGEADFSLAIYGETGWIKEARLLSIIGLDK